MSYTDRVVKKVSDSDFDSWVGGADDLSDDIRS